MNLTNKKNKILLVEDETGIQKLFEYNLQKAGYLCVIAQNGAEGLEIAKKEKPDLILSDIMMPVMDGYQFRKKLLDDDKLSKIPFVFLTAKGEEEDILKGYDLQIEDYIIKTSSPKIVLAKISSILRSKLREREEAISEIKNAANDMNAKVVPDTPPVFEGFEIKHWHKPFEEIPGGDFIDYIKIDDFNLMIVLGDVMGKKWGAWYFAMAYAGYVRSAVRMAVQSNAEITPATILEKVNKSVYYDERIADVFITLSIISLNNIENKLMYAGAGDLPLIFKGKSVTTISSNGLLLGFDPNSNYDNIELKLEKGNSIFLTTDGLTDSRNQKGESFGLERLKFILKDMPDDAAPLEFIKNNFIEFTGGATDDDVSLVAVMVK